MSSHALSRKSIGVALPILIIAVWWYTSRDSTSPFFPPLQRIGQAFKEDWLFQRVPTDLLPSLARFATGLVSAIVLGTGLGVVIGLSGRLRMAVDPIIDFLRSLPPPALVPVSLLIFGIGDAGKVFVILAGALWPVLINTIDGVRSVDCVVRDVASVYRFNRRDRLLRVVIPSASPQIFAGLRIAVSVALILMIVSEMVASTNGLGYFTLQAQQSFAIPDMWTGVLLLGAIGFVVNATFSWIERVILAWHRGWRATNLGQ